MYHHQEDFQLIEIAKQGNPRAFDALMLRYQPRIFKIVARFVKDPSESLDVCQEVFIKVYRGLDKFRADSSFYTWIYRISVNTAKNFRLSRTQALQGIDIENIDMNRLIMRNSLKEFGTPERLMMRDEMAGIVYQTINNMPEELRTAIKLREIEGLSYEKISDVMHCPLGTVRSRIFRARSVLEKHVQPLL